jgi:predicted AAA+ superfamily ATPase
VSRSLRPRGPLDAPAQIEDLALEVLVAQHLRTLCQLRPDGASLTFWRTRAGLEVDFVLYGPGLFQAIGVKRSRCVDRRDLSALRAFVEDYPEAELLLLSLCEEPLLIDGIRCLPLESWLRELRP